MTLEATITAMKAAGCTAQQIGEVVLALADAKAPEPAAAPSARSERNRRYYLRRLAKATEASEPVVLKATESDLKATEIPAPRVSAPTRVLYGEEVSIIPPIEPTVLSPTPPAPADAVAPKTDRARGTRLPDDWAPDAELRRFAIDELGSRDEAVRETEKFRDYWQAKAGADARKTNWGSTYRNWIRRAAEHRPTARAGPASQPHRPNVYQAAAMDFLNELADQGSPESFPFDQPA